MRTSELIGPALDWAVAKAEGIKITMQWGKPHGDFWINDRTMDYYELAYSTDWTQGGPIIEREDISFRKYHNPGKEAHGKYYAKVCRESGEKVWWSKRDMTGPTPLIAAMRCYVASKLGDEVEIPEVLR